MDLYLVSDLHHYPEPEEHPGRRAFFSFLTDLRRLEDPGALWILGDLFDFWFEYGTVTPSGHEHLLTLLADLTRAGWEVDLIPGNHDFSAGRRFSLSTGAEVHCGRTVELLHGGRRLVLAHGDGLGPGDLGYRAIRPLLRSRVTRALFRILHPDLGIRLARLFSGTSRRILRKDLDHVPHGLEIWAERVLAAGADIVVTGHSHMGRVKPFGNGLHVSLGDWLTRRSYCIVRESSEIVPTLLDYSENEGIDMDARSSVGGEV